MQTVSSQYPNNANQQTRKVALIAILLFALSGLISGFAVGAFVQPRAHTGSGTGTGTTGSRTKPIAHATPSQGTTAVSENVNLDDPLIKQGDYSYFQIANGSTSYTLSALILNKNKTPIQASDVSCRLWLTKDGDVNSILGADHYAIPRSIGTFQQPFPKEAVGALNFIAPSQQVQFCAPNGKTTWTYTISPSIDPGTYYLVTLASWRGKSFSWYWLAIMIKKAN
jgi:hypothetical protein